MNKREILLNALKGNMEYGIPWVPRMDIWYYGNLYRDTLPKEFKELSLEQIIEKLGFTYNKILPDFADNYALNSVKDRLLGVFASKDIPYEIMLDSSIKREINTDNDLIQVTYQTSKKDNLTGSFRMGEELKKQGSTLPPIKEHLIRSDEDYSKVMDIFSSIKIIPKPENYQELLDGIGDDGYPPIYGHLAASPMQAILRDLMNPTFFFIEYKLNLNKLLELCKVLERFLLNIVETIIRCSEEPIVVWGGNYDSVLTFPPFFEAHILPFLNQVCEIIHGKKGLVISHCDGENDQLLGLYRKSGIDILQAVNTAPIVKNTYREIKSALRPEQVVFGGIPSAILLDSIFSDTQFRDFLTEFKKSYRKGDPLIMEVSDNVPPDTNMDRLRILGEFAGNL
ncbi:MAG: hypothetical protein ABIK53_09490 [bacterium]